MLISTMASPADNSKSATVAEVLAYELRSAEGKEDLARLLFFKFNGYEYDETNPEHQFSSAENRPLPNPPYFRLSIGSCRWKAENILYSPNILDELIPRPTS